MNSPRWQEIDKIFQAAVEQPPELRSSFLDETCSGDESLRSDVEALLSSDEQNWSLIDSPAFEAAAPFLSETRPVLDIGQRLAYYEVVELIGRGGMGEVYLAEDTRLGRKVALKLLATDLTRNDSLVALFQQEARAASSLNHPNILTIHEIGKVDDRQFIVTEFIEGETLRQKMRRGQLGVWEILDITVQVAGALAAAHTAGIVHKDIKPENIMVRPDGYAKVLDFGLAELVEARPSTNQSESQSDGATPVRGTVRYMSPEQARGLALDHRSDIFSLGVVLYEMIAGCPPFEGETNSDLITSIQNEEPLSLRQHSSDSPDELQRIVSKALHKDKQQRYQTINEMLSDLRNLKQDSELEAKIQLSGKSASGGAPSVARRGTQLVGETESSNRASGLISSAPLPKGVISKIKHHQTLVVLVLLILAAAASFITYRLRWIGRQPEPLRSMHIARLTNNGKTYHAAISRDGKSVVYKLYENGQSSLWLRNLSTGSDVQILAPAEVGYGGLSFSPDGKYVYYVQVDKTDTEGALYRIPVAGGGTTKLLADIYNYVTFSPDGTRMAFVRNDEAHGESSLMVANVDGTGEQKLAARKLPDYFECPAWSPDGRVIACAAGDTNGDNQGNHHNVVEVRIADGAEKPISGWWRGMTRIAWLSDGSGILMAAKERPARPRQIWNLSYPGGVVQRITNDTNDYNELSLTADSSNVLAVQGEALFGIWIAPNEDRSQFKKVILGANKGDGQYGVSWTPEGRIVYESDVGQNYDIWIMDTDGSNRTKLTFDPRLDAGPIVTPDGHHILFSSDRAGTINLWTMDIDGSSQKQLTHGQNEIDSTCSPDGQWVVYSDFRSGKAMLQRISIQGDDAAQLSNKVIDGSAISPDGKLIAGFYLDEQENRWRLAIIPFEGGDPMTVFDLPADIDRNVPIRWTPDGQALTYCCRRVTTSNVWSQPIVGGRPRQLTDFKSDHIEYFDWSRDGRLAVVRGTESNDAVLISNFK